MFYRDFVSGEEAQGTEGTRVLENDITESSGDTAGVDLVIIK